MARQVTLVALSSVVQSACATEVHAGANPVRKVVNLLQAMQKKVTAEGDHAEELYKKFMCYCQNSGGDLATSIKAAGEKGPQLEASIKAASDKKTQLEADLKQHQTDRSAAKKAMEEATALRKKEKGEFDKMLADNKANLAATIKAVGAISAGMGGSFLQTSAAADLRSLLSRRNMDNSARQDVLSFLSGEDQGEYAPASGEITGILKQMGDEMAADQKEMIAAEDASIKNYNELMAAKKKEEAALSKSIESKLTRVGDLGVDIATMKADAEDTAEGLAQDQKFAKDMKKNCAEKTGIHEEEKKMRSQELLALADTIKLLNSDDALELFKKTLPSASASFLEVQESTAMLKNRAREIIASSREHTNKGRHHLDFILLALRGNKIGVDKIVKLIDDLVSTLTTEQADDNDKKEYCEAQFDKTEDKKKVLELQVKDINTLLTDGKESVATLASEITALTTGIKALDKALGEATEQRKAEEAAFKELMSSNTAAKELILFAKNRLNKFYNPKLYKPPPAEAFIEDGTAPPPPPATAAAYTKKAGDSNGVIAMMDLLVADLDKEMTIAKTEEGNSKEEYEQTVVDSADKRRQDSKALTDKDAAKADLEAKIEEAGANKKSTVKDLYGVEKYLGSLHGECDWLIKFFEVRKQARTDEIDSLGKAKAVLSGADFSLLQRNAAKVRKFLRRV